MISNTKQGFIRFDKFPYLSIESRVSEHLEAKQTLQELITSFY